MPNEEIFNQTDGTNEQPQEAEIEYADEAPLGGMSHFEAMANDYAADEEPDVPEEEVTPEPEVEPEPEPEAPSEEEVPPPHSFALELPADMFTAQELADIEEAQGSFDPAQQARANIFIARRVAQYEATAANLAQQAFNSVPEGIRQLHGGAINHYLQNLCAPNRRNSTEAINEAQSYALAMRANQIGFDKALAEMAGRVGAAQAVTHVPAETRPPAERPVIPAERRTPTSSVSGAPVRTPVPRSRQDMQRAKLEKSLGMDLSEV